MARLPIVGSDDDTWGAVLNDFLEVSLNADGTLQTGAISNSGGELIANKGIASGYAALNGNGLVPSAQLGSGTGDSSTYLRGDGSWQAITGSSTLAGDTDVSLDTPATGEVLTFNGTDWTNEAVPVTSVAGMTGAVTLGENDIIDLPTDLATKAEDSTVVHNTGNEMVGGVKTFTNAPVLPSAALPESATANLTSDLAAKYSSGNPPPYPVTSVFGRTGAVTAQSGDYAATDVGAVAASAVGAVNGVAALDGTGLVPTAQLPSIDSLLTAPLELPATSGNALTTEGGNTLDDGDGNASFNASSAVTVNDGSGTALLTADTSDMYVLIGNGTDTIKLNPTNGITYGSGIKKKAEIILTAEYAGAVLDNGNASNDVGTMSAGFDPVQRESYYLWTTEQDSNQTYDIVVQIPLPSNFRSWVSSGPLKVDVNTSDTTNGTVTGTLYDTTGTVVSGWNTYSLTPGSTGWQTTGSSNAISSGTFVANGIMTFRLHLQAPQNGETAVGNITLSYCLAY